jgi:hypothetical protein
MVNVLEGEHAVAEPMLVRQLLQATAAATATAAPLQQQTQLAVRALGCMCMTCKAASINRTSEASSLQQTPNVLFSFCI